LVLSVGKDLPGISQRSLRKRKNKIKELWRVDKKKKQGFAQHKKEKGEASSGLHDFSVKGGTFNSSRRGVEGK